jgi:hypothetical protein
MILLCEKTNGLWHKNMSEGKNESYEDCFAKLLDGTAKRNAEIWRKKDSPRIQIDLKAWSERISTVMCEEVRFDLFEESVGSSEFAKVVGIGPIGRRYLFDIYYSDINKSSISSITFPQKKARDIAKSICGVYEVKFKDPLCGKFSIGMMDVRYYMPVGLDNRHSKQFKIRCKLNVPSEVESKRSLREKTFEYNGYLSVSRGWYTFTMESRSDAYEQRVLSLMVSSDENGAGLNGRYLKTPFDGDGFGMHGSIEMKLSRKHDAIIDPHTILSEI